jgi:type II secretory pathway component PulC
VTRIGLSQAKEDKSGRLITPESKFTETNQVASDFEVTVTLPLTAREVRNLVVRKLTLLKKVVSAEPNYVNGKLNGYRILPNTHNPTFLETYGILDGDVVSKVNDIELKSQKQAIRALRIAVKAESLEIVVMRDEIEIPITISLDR